MSAPQRPAPRHAAGRRTTPRPAPRRRREVRPRYGRAALAAAAALATLVALLGGIGALPLLESEPTPPAQAEVAAAADVPDRWVRAGQSVSVVSREMSAATKAHARELQAEKRRAAAHAARISDRRLPADSGEGRRAVFDMSAQRVWIVDADG